MAVMNDELASRVLSLAEANKELESFSYTVSHDLRTPLTIIENYAFLLRKTQTQNLPPEAVRALDGIQAAIGRMATIIQNILDMSRVGRMPVRRQELDLARLAREILHELHEREPQRMVDLMVPAAIPVHADPAILRVALANLLGNAWKFSAKAPRPTITVGLVAGRSPATYFVKDNGVGFAMKDSGRLFQAFERLHDASEFAGTGIGLATVARAVARHGGTVWCEAAPGQGATFFFTLGDETQPAAGGPA